MIMTSLTDHSEYKIQSKLVKKGKQETFVDLGQLAQEFTDFHAQHGSQNFDPVVLTKFVDLVSIMMFDNHYVKFNPATNQWLAEEEPGKGPWVVIDPHDYFEFKQLAAN